MRSSPIGVLDSGVGCLTVLSGLTRSMPAEDWLVLQDSKYAAYGQLSSDVILERTLLLVARLQSQGVKAVVLACHTSSALALEEVAQHASIPVMGVLRPTAFALAQRYCHDHIVWLATPASIRANKLPGYARDFGFQGEITPLACPGWVDVVESGSWHTPQFIADISAHLAPTRQMDSQGCLRILYGCTHYPWLHPVVTTILPEGVQCLDPSTWVARACRQLLADKHLLSSADKRGRVQFLDGATISERWHTYRSSQGSEVYEG